MEVLHSHYLSGALAYPAVYLIDPGIDPDKIHSRQVHALAPAVHGPGYVDGRSGTGIGVIVRIAVAELVEDVVCPLPALVDTVLRQAGTTEREPVLPVPLREIGLGVILVFRDAAPTAQDILPKDVFLFFGGCRFLFRTQVRHTVVRVKGHVIAVVPCSLIPDFLRRVDMGTSGYLIP